MSKPMMKCGHAANAVDGKTGAPVCVICIGIVDGADQIDPNPPSLDGREAECDYCKKRQPSSTSLAFFEHRADKQFDRYYCGCRGWD